MTSILVYEIDSYHSVWHVIWYTLNNKSAHYPCVLRAWQETINLVYSVCVCILHSESQK